MNTSEEKPLGLSQVPLSQLTDSELRVLIGTLMLGLSYPDKSEWVSHERLTLALNEHERRVTGQK